jgi:BirA family transcriptional regulator, biotin operon repressor / biotin---[acetyl-CoA-carboxylase] ligase
MIGKTILELESTGSTNAYANQVFAASGFKDGTVIWAHEQTAGRGQHDHKWISEAGKNLTITVCLRPRFLSPGRQFRLNMAIALGVLDFIRSFPQPASRFPHPVFHIKWPNDIYAGNLKIGGILIENKIMGPVLESSFAGIGVNINQTRFPPDIPNPVSLIHFVEQETVLKDAVRSLCGFLDNRYTELKRMAEAGLNIEFDQNLLGFGEWRYFLRGKAHMEGKIQGVDSSGRLMVETRGAEILYFSHQEIEYIL